MSTATEITRLQTARNTIRDKLIEFGLATSTAKLDALATAVDGIENKGAISASVQEGDTYTIPKGYHNGSGTVSGVAGGGNYSLQSKTVTPTKSQQSVTPDQGFYGLSDVTVKAIPETYQNVSAVTATAGDVLANKVIVDATGATKTGTMPNNGAVEKTLDTNTTQYIIPKGYHNGQGIVEVSLEEKTATPAVTEQGITPSSGKVLSKVTVAAIPSNFADTSDATGEAADVLFGKIVYGKRSTGEATKITGAMPNNGAAEKTLDTNTTQYVIPKGYHNGQGAVGIVLEEKTVTPERTLQAISPTAGKVLGSVTVNAIPKTYQDALETVNGIIAESASKPGASAGAILNGEYAYVGDENTNTVVKVVGTMPNRGAVSATIDGLTKTSYTVPEGYHNGSGIVRLTNDIETALAAI